jgi:hypothetical protein
VKLVVRVYVTASEAVPRLAIMLAEKLDRQHRGLHKRLSAVTSTECCNASESVDETMQLRTP